MRYFLFLLAALSGAAPAWAEHRAVVIGNADYRHAPDLSGWDTGALARAMREAGFTTSEGIDQSAPDLRHALDLLARADPDGGARIVALSGRFLHGGNETWFLGVEADQPALDEMGRVAVPLSLIMGQMAEGRPGAVLLLGTDQQDMPHHTGLRSGIGALPEVPGVSVIQGGSDSVARAWRELAAGQSVAKALSSGRGLRPAEPGEAMIFPVTAAASRKPALPEPEMVERGFWSEAVASDTMTGYGAYLRRYPSGVFSGAASDRIAYLHRRGGVSPGAGAATPAGEAALELGRDERAKLQQALARLGYDPGAVDGVFGLRTRQSLSEWQVRSGFPASGFLSAEQMRQLLRQVSETEVVAHADDAGFWQRLGERRGESRIWAYLTGRAARPGVALSETRGNETQLWLWARRQDTGPAYEIYLERFPQGLHAGEARLRLANTSAASEAARRDEGKLGLTTALRRRIEGRLEAEGYDCGSVDGSFDDRTRHALRLYQAAHDQRVTGFLSRDTLAALLDEGVSAAR
ncbi:peptidoglycan-binding protein [Paracoccus ravus]|uniref:peptidoglycan-binding protein n=1 Tax=Paracoccus ravus TaxID=2447760 RepID=UPI00106DE24A|nr:peptidoglycan-binding protein [Paracoccus ravus]